MLSVHKKCENHKNSPHSKITFYIIFIYLFFLRDNKIFTYGGARGQAAGVIRSEKWKNHRNNEIL